MHYKRYMIHYKGYMFVMKLTGYRVHKRWTYDTGGTATFEYQVCLSLESPSGLL